MAGENDVGALVVRLQAQNEELKKTLRQSEKAIKEYAKEAERANRGVGAAVEQVATQTQRSVEQTEKKVRKSTNGMTKAFKQMSTIAGGFIQAQLLMRLAAIPGQVINGVKEATLAYDKIDRRLRFVMKTADDASIAFAKLDTISNKYGTDLKASAQFYSSFLAATDATNISLAQAEDLFLGTSQAAVALQMSTYQTEASFRAFQQMASKGRVAAEELRGQLGEALPGALGIAARSMNMPIEQLSKIMEKGELLAEDLLPAMGKELQKVFSGAAMDASETYLANLNRIENEWFKLLAGVGKGSEGLLMPFLKDTANVLETINAIKAQGGSIFGIDLGDIQRGSDAISSTRMAIAELDDITKEYEGKGWVYTAIWGKEGGEKKAQTAIADVKRQVDSLVESLSFKEQKGLLAIFDNMVARGRGLSESERDVYSHLSDSSRESIDRYNIMQDTLALGLKMNEMHKQDVQYIAEQLGIWNEIRPIVDEISTQQHDINKFNKELAEFPLHAQMEATSKALYDQLDLEEKLLQTKINIQEVTNDLAKLNVTDYASLRVKREAFNKLKAVYVKLLKEELGIERAIKEEDKKKELNSFVSPELDTKGFDRVLGIQQTPIEEVQEEWREIEAEYIKHKEAILKSEADHKAELDKLDKQYREAKLKRDQAMTHAVLQTNAQMFGDLATIMAGFAGEQSGIYKTMFAISKAFAIADGAIKVHQAVLNAMASGPFPWNLGAMASVAAAGASLMNQITSATASFEGGGFTGRGDRVGGVDGRGGFPAILHPNEMVTDMTKSRGGSSGGVTVNINNLPGQTAEATSSADGKTIEITIKRTKQEIASEIRRGAGDINKALNVRDRRTGGRK